MVACRYHRQELGQSRHLGARRAYLAQPRLRRAAARYGPFLGGSMVGKYHPIGTRVVVYTQDTSIRSRSWTESRAPSSRHTTNTPHRRAPMATRSGVTSSAWTTAH